MTGGYGLAEEFDGLSELANTILLYGVYFCDDETKRPRIAKSVMKTDPD